MTDDSTETPSDPESEPVSHVDVCEAQSETELESNSNSDIPYHMFEYDSKSKWESDWESDEPIGE